MKTQWVSELKPGQKVDDLFVIRRLEIKEFNGRKFMSLEFGDRTGRIGAVCWEGIQELSGQVGKGSVIRVQGTVGTYRETPQITVLSMQPMSSSAYDPADFLPAGSEDPAKLMSQIDEVVARVQDRHYHELLRAIFEDGIIRRKFSWAPAAKLWHHAFVGGLAEHTLNVARLCEAACAIYPRLDKDLLLTGALLHDVGKIDTYSLERFFDYTDEGRLIGHIVIADRLVTTKIARLADFPAEKRKLVRHLILSHQGTYDQGSPVLPQTLEANVLYIADLLDSRVGGIMKVIGKSQLPGQRWSDYVNLIERHIYLGDARFEESEQEGE